MSITQAQVAIITVTYNSSGFIEDYLQAITHFISANTQHQLYIVDNASSDNTCDLIKTYREQHQLSDKLHIIELSENIGFGKGCNTGIDAAKNDTPTHFWLLNPDTQVNNSSGQALLSLMKQAPHIDFAGSALVNKEGTPRAGAFRFPTLLNVALSSLKLGLLDKLFNNHITAIPISNTPYPADWLTGASFMAKAESMYQLAGFDPQYFLYFEEVDLFFRAKKLGHSAWACPESQVFHISGASTGINNHKKAIKPLPSYWFESRRYYYLNNYGRIYFTAVDLALITCQCLWTLRAKLQSKEDDTPPHFLKSIIKHSYISQWLRTRAK